MREIIDRLVDWSAAGKDFALATVVRTDGSAPSPAGSAMAVAADGDVIGGMSAGYVESAIVESARRVLESGDSSMLRFGAHDSTLAIGPACGGSVEILVKHSRRVGGHLRTLQHALRCGRAAALVTVIDGPVSDVGTQCAWDSGKMPSPAIPEPVLDALNDGLRSAHVVVETERGEGTVFVHCFPPRADVAVSLDRCVGQA